MSPTENTIDTILYKYQEIKAEMNRLGELIQSLKPEEKDDEPPVYESPRFKFRRLGK